MDAVEVQILREENIKPSVPTPDHLRRYNLSFLDQISTPVFMPFVLFFSRDISDSNDKLLDRIRKSLSEALAQFYPLAGRIRENKYIYCNDEGVHYVEARAKCDLASILDNPVPKLMNNFLPLELDDPRVNELPVAVQVNVFDCGGIGLGLCVSHKVGDALSQVTFLNGWAANARGEPNPVCPLFGSASIFPPVDISGFPLYTGIVKDDIVTRRLVFDSGKIESLRERYTDQTSPDRQKCPTRAEALSTFLWSRYMASTLAKESLEIENNTKLYTLLHAVNLRPRMDPPLSDLHFGNISRVAIAAMGPDTSGQLVLDGYEIVNRVRDAISRVDPDYVKKLGMGSEHLGFLKERGEKVVKGEVVTLNFTSLCNFPIYGADFWWGKPVWVGYASLMFKNLVVLLDAESGGGVEVWVSLGSEDMAKFEKDKEVMANVSPIVKKSM